LVWIKSRGLANDHYLFDTNRGANKRIESNTTDEQVTATTTLSAFNANGFSLDGGASATNTNGQTYASWTFRKQPKFFDVVTYTGTGVARTVAHSLGSVPGCIIVKRTDSTGDWIVYHRSLTNTQYLRLNLTNAVGSSSGIWDSTTPTSTQFTLGASTANSSGGTYVAYLFAHDAGGFGLTGTDNVISCGSYTGNNTGSGFVNLGWEPQWILIKRTNTTSSWYIVDNMRGWDAGGTMTYLLAESAVQEFSTASGVISPAATGFSLGTNASGELNASGNTYIYIAIRRGPMKVPTTGTSVFQPVTYTGTNVDNRLVNTGIVTDMTMARIRTATSTGGFYTADRLRGNASLGTAITDAENTDADSFMTPTVGFGNSFSAMNGFGVGNDATRQLNQSSTAQLAYAFRRAPGFFDEVCYSGSGSSPQVLTHNLTVTPEMMIVKFRDGSTNWYVYTATVGNTGALYLESTGTPTTSAVFWNNTSPTATQFTVGSFPSGAGNYAAYLFASCPGVSKVGSYTGTGTTQTIDCGFTAGSRFVLIKRTDSTGDWYVWDSARGIVAGNDPYLRLNSTSADVTNADFIDTASTGFEISSTAPAAINASGGSFIFLAIA